MEISDERLSEVIRAHEHPEDWPYGEEVACLDEKEELALCIELQERRKADRLIVEALAEIQNGYCNEICERCPDHTEECKRAVSALKAAPPEVSNG